jgi:hypothetical protein
MPDPADPRRPIDRLPAHQRPFAHRVIQCETMALLVEVYQAMRAGQDALTSALAAEPPEATADALDRLIAVLEPLQAKAKAVRNLCEDRRTPRERGQARWPFANDQNQRPEILDPVPRLARKVAHAARR